MNIIYTSLHTGLLILLEASCGTLNSKGYDSFKCLQMLPNNLPKKR